MKVSKLISLLAIPLCVGTAVAQSTGSASPTEAPIPTLSRAEVIADLSSGLRLHVSIDAVEPNQMPSVVRVKNRQGSVLVFDRCGLRPPLQ